MRILGIDYGSRRIGLALGDTESCLATPFKVMENTDLEDVIERILRMISEEEVEEVVVGVPQTPDGEAMSETSKSVLAFIQQLREKGLKIHEENELLSSKVAAAQVKETGRKEKRDDLAATAILQTYLDRS